jgi:hypothetical protein
VNQNLNKICLLVFATFGLNACGTPASVNDLATRTAANVSQVGTHLQNLSRTAEWIATARARNIANLKATVREVEKRHTLDIALIEQTGDRGLLTEKDRLAEWMTKARAAARGMTVAEFKNAPKSGSINQFSDDIKEVTNSLESLDAKTAALNQVAKKLAALSKKDDTEARARYLISYVKEIRTSIEEKREVAATAAEASKSAAETAASTDQEMDKL